MDTCPTEHAYVGRTRIRRFFCLKISIAVRTRLLLILPWIIRRWNALDERQLGTLDGSRFEVIDVIIWRIVCPERMTVKGPKHTLRSDDCVALQASDHVPVTYGRRLSRRSWVARQACFGTTSSLQYKARETISYALKLRPGVDFVQSL